MKALEAVAEAARRGRARAGGRWEPRWRKPSMEPEAEKRGREAMAHGNPMPKFYKSVMDDVIEGVRDVFMEEGVDEQVLKELQRRWESKLMQSKAMEGFFRHRNVLPQFTLHLPHHFHQMSTGAAAVRGIRQFATSASATTAAGAAVEPAAERGSSRTGSAFLTLPSGLAYPIQIPAGVTLQTASGKIFTDRS
nr:PREDICTED: TFIIA-alpha and beta-like factor [Anolis carolinensis]|eukprot:XP_008100921.2 PREDICTED: TFIIA-alpha and beta-like factor [Anolis carolinensis]